MIKKVLTISLVGFIALSCNKNKTVQKLENDDQKAAYAIGIDLGNGVSNFEKTLPLEEKFSKEELIAGMNEVFASSKNISKSKFQGMQMAVNIEAFLRQNNITDKIDKDIIIQGLANKIDKQELLFKETEINTFADKYFRPLIEKAQKQNQESIEKRRLEEGKKNAAESEKFLNENKSKAGVKETPSGLQYKELKAGDGKTKVTANEIVSVKFKGTLVDGTEFDSTDKSGGNPIDFPASNVIPGWQEGLKLMTKGSKYQFFIPAKLGYGEQGSGPVGPNQALIFEVELLDIKANNTPAPTAPEIQLNANGVPAQPAK